MIGMGDEVGEMVCRYMTRYSDRAYARISDDASVAIARKNWRRLHLLERAKLRLLRLQIVYGNVGNLR